MSPIRYSPDTNSKDEVNTFDSSLKEGWLSSDKSEESEEWLLEVFGKADLLFKVSVLDLLLSESESVLLLIVSFIDFLESEWVYLSIVSVSGFLKLESKFNSLFKSVYFFLEIDSS